MKTRISVILITLLIVLIPVSSAVALDESMKDDLDSNIEEYLEEYRVPGAAVALVRDGKVFYSNTWGVTGESEEPITLETPFTLGSISKSLTALAIVKLIDEGKINLEDPVQTHLSWFTLPDDQAASQITIKHLLSQTSGFSPYTGLAISDHESKSMSAIQHTAKSLTDAKLSAKPGEIHQYSNANFIILGALIEEVSGQVFTEFMEEHIFLPLGMEHAASDYESAVKKGYQLGYQSWFGFPVKSSITYDNGGVPYGYITANTQDMLAYLEFIRSNEGLLSEENWELYQTPVTETGTDRFYGLGLRITSPGTKDEMIWHSGSTADSHSEFFYFPESDWGGIILTNKNHILEEIGLVQLKQGIINIVNEDEAVEISKNTPTVQLIILGVILLLGVLFILLVKKRKVVKRKKIWGIIGFLQLVVAVAIIPLLTFSTSSPWHAIHVFAPDLAFTIIVLIIMLVINGLFLLVVSLRRSTGARS
ncbi:serine hydrolase [Paucisalibacillus sp. EB02]|uniref:serine hydrolase domain-containing protein n=1 Tax=Paucisalibacillus sp. EB02 TaxID=1347087 RepID=UPI0004B68580|nr:serine hydrolase domain-containing protein [Paucisalibacillus sp. EB02]